MRWFPCLAAPGLPSSLLSPVHWVQTRSGEQCRDMPTTYQLSTHYLPTIYINYISIDYLLTIYLPWNNGKSEAKLDLTSSTTPGLQIHKFDHTWTANPCDWLPCCRAALPLVGCPHSLVYLHLPVVEGLIFCISATPH